MQRRKGAAGSSGTEITAMTEQTVLVTGGAGYIGSHACKALARAGFRPVAYDNLVYGHKWAVKWGPFVHGDILDRERLEWAMREHDIKAVMHFAAFAYVGESVSDPAKYYRNNVTGALNLLDAVRACGIRKFVFSSSCATYGIPGTPLIHEDLHQAPVNPYGRSKLMIEHVLRDYAPAYGLSSIALRYFNAAGADPDGETGEDHDPETHLIPLVLQTAAGMREQVTVFGSDYDTPDGTCIRDYIHVCDLADAHVLALKALDGQGGMRPFNLGTGTGLSVQQIIAAAREITGRPITVTMGARRAGDPPVLVADASRARQHLGWTPQRSSVEDMIGTAWRWLEALGAG
jgi:UDP-arabinose 4-epimerase